MANASLQAVIHACLAGYAEDHPLSPRQWQVCHHLLDCRTAARWRSHQSSEARR